MNTLLWIIVLVIILGALAWFMFGRGRAAPKKAEPARVRTIRELQPGDAVSYWTGDDEAVQGVVKASELVNGRETGWRWAFLNEDRLLEAAPDGLTLYGDPEVVYQGSADFEKFVPPHGVLATFEERVREGIVGSNPVFIEHRGRRYRIVSTGTFGAELLGDAEEREIWQDANTEDPTQNVYFEMQLAPGQEEAADREVLGIWTSHILLYYGMPFDEGSVRGLYTG